MLNAVADGHGPSMDDIERLRPFRELIINRRTMNTPVKKPSLMTILRPVFGVLVALTVLAIVELGLRVAGYAGPSGLEDPYLGFEDIYPLYGKRGVSGESEVYGTNPNKLRFFNDEEFLVPKPDGVYRIFCFGGSTTYGRPFKAPTAYSNWLEILLNDMDPTRRYEVINAGGISYASYRIVYLVREALKFEPDLFVVCSGHNEFLERRTYKEILDRQAEVRLATRYLSSLRIYDLLRQLIDSFREERDVDTGKTLLPDEVDTILDHSAGPDLYSREVNQKPEVLSHYRYNLSHMGRIAADGGVPILFMNLASNLADFSPFKSEQREDLTPGELMVWGKNFDKGMNEMKAGDMAAARESFEKALDIDNRHADLLFRMGRADLALGLIDDALGYLVRARDEDVCPLRAPSEINRLIRETAEELNVEIVDIVTPFVERNRELVGHRILGNSIFLDHLHPTIEGHQIMANQIARWLIESGRVSLSPAWDAEKTRRHFDDLLTSLGDDYFAGGNLNLGKVLLWARKAREALVPLKIAAERIPDNAGAHFTLGTCLSRLGRSEDAIAEFQRALAIDPENNEARNNLGLELRKIGDLQDAMNAFQRVLRSEPDNYNVLNNMGLIAYSRGDLDTAERLFRKALDKWSENAEVYNNLGIIRMARDDYAAAESMFREARRLRSHYMDALHNLTISLVRQEKVDEALEVCREALNMFPASPEFYNLLGEMLMTNEEYEGAREAFETALYLRPGWEQARRNLESIPEN